MRMRRIFIYGLAAVQYLSTLSHKRHDFQGKKFTEHKKSFVIFSINFV